MCNVINIGTDTDLILVCEKTRKEVHCVRVIDDYYDYFCEDRCDFEERKKYYEHMDKIVTAMADDDFEAMGKAMADAFKDLGGDS